MLSAPLQHLSDALQELLLGGGLDEDVVDQLQDARVAGQGLVAALSPPVSRGGEPHWGHLVVEFPLGKEE